MKPRARFTVKRIGRLIAQPLALRIAPRSRWRSLNHVRITLGSEMTRTTAAIATSTCHHAMPFTLAAIAATAVPIMPTPMPMAATELAIAAPPADPPAVA